MPGTPGTDAIRRESIGPRLSARAETVPSGTSEGVEVQPRRHRPIRPAQGQAGRVSLEPGARVQPGGVELRGVTGGRSLPEGRPARSRRGTTTGSTARPSRIASCWAASRRPSVVAPHVSSAAALPARRNPGDGGPARCGACHKDESGQPEEGVPAVPPTDSRLPHVQPDGSRGEGQGHAQPDQGGPPLPGWSAPEQRGREHPERHRGEGERQPPPQPRAQLYAAGAA